MATAKTVRERQEEQRKEKLREIKRQVKDGSLVVRQMTKKERAEADKRLKAAESVKLNKRPKARAS
jgi:hypothetical protein